MFEHARGPVPKRWHGYCVDDVTRALIVICREPEPAPELVRLAEIYLAFLLHAQDRERGFHNRLGYDRQWHDEPETGEWWGRGVWALGTAASAARHPGSARWPWNASPTGSSSAAPLGTPWRSPPSAPPKWPTCCPTTRAPGNSWPTP
ncbi:hypothetical protein ACFQ9X_42935 [Catenulispora yoronensis]